MRPTPALLLTTTAACFFAVCAGVGKSASKNNLSPSVKLASPPKPSKPAQVPDKLFDAEHDATPLSQPALNATVRHSKAGKLGSRVAGRNPVYLYRNPKVYVRVIYSIEDHGRLYINYGSRSKRSHRERIRFVQRPRHHNRVSKWTGWLHSGSVIGFHAVNDRGPGGLIFAIHIRVGRRWVRHISGKYPVRLRTVSPRSRYMGWMKVNYRPCRWHKALGRYVHNLRISRHFPYKSKAKYVWPWERRGRRDAYHIGHVLYRYKLGGECGFRPPGIPPPRPVVRRHFRHVTIYFASKNKGYLFINGRRVRILRDSQLATTWSGHLRVGTTVGFQATSHHGPSGIIASILIRHGKRRYVFNTGRYPFRVHRISSRNRRFNLIWRFPVYNTCRWPRATKAFVHSPRISKKFKYSTGAKYIWFPKSFNRRGTMFMRFRIGGERCHPHPRRNFRLVTIYFATGNIGYFYINGRVRRVIRNAKDSAQWRGWVRLGSTIGIKATNRRGPGGIIASILVQHGRRKYRLNTGRYPFRVHPYWKNRRLRRLNHIWKFPAYKTCGWPRAKGPWVHNLKISKKFPYYLRAKYIWAPGNSNHVGTIFLRYRLGGERCHRPPVPPKPGRGCPCRKSASPNRGDCYYFIGKEPTGIKPGFCKKKTCEAKYHCTSRSRAKGRCIWKFATHEVKEISSIGRLVCRRMKLGERRRFLVPYSA